MATQTGQNHQALGCMRASSSQKKQKSPGLLFRQALLAADVGVGVHVESFVALVQGTHPCRTRVKALLLPGLALVQLRQTVTVTKPRGTKISALVCATTASSRRKPTIRPNYSRTQKQTKSLAKTTFVKTPINRELSQPRTQNKRFNARR